MRCRLCGNELEGQKRVWCSHSCKNRWRRTVPNKELQCLACGTIVLIPPARLYLRKYCSKRCSDSHYNRRNFRGPQNPNWRGGRVLSYGAGWKQVKQEVRARDEVCQDCGKTPEDNGRALDVHHIHPFRFSGSNSLDNLVALCRSCHMRGEDNGRKGSARFAGPRQLELRPLSQREQQRSRGRQQRERRRALMEEAHNLRKEGHSLRAIGQRLSVSHQTVANWL